MWKHPTKPVAWLFFLTRYPALLSQLISAGLNSYTPGCNSVARLLSWMTTIALAAGYVFQSLRAQALWGQGRHLSMALLVICLPAVGCEAWRASSVTCAADQPQHTQINIRYASELLFESTVLAITVWRTRSLASQQRVLRSAQGTLAVEMLHNEIVYYTIV